MFFLRRNQTYKPDRADYDVLLDERGTKRVIGRIYYGGGRRGDQWVYALGGWGHDVADSLDDAKAKLKRRWELHQQRFKSE